MYPARFRYVRPETLDEALSALAELGDDARVLAGGASLIPWMKYRQVCPEVVVDVGALNELRGIARRDGKLVIGALTTHAQAAEDDDLATALPNLHDVAATIGDPQVRNMGTTGGALAAVELTGDWGPALIALGGWVTARSRDGAREIPASELFVDTLRSSLRPGELITEVVVPLPGQSSGSAHVKFMLRSVTALGSCSAALTLQDGHVAALSASVGGIGPIPVAAPEVSAAVTGRELTQATIEEAKRRARETLAAQSDTRTSAEHRLHDGGELIGRALTAARERALGVHGGAR